MMWFMWQNSYWHLTDIKHIVPMSNQEALTLAQAFLGIVSNSGNADRIVLFLNKISDNCITFATKSIYRRKITSRSTSTKCHYISQSTFIISIRSRPKLRVKSEIGNVIWPWWKYGKPERLLCFQSDRMVQRQNRTTNYFSLFVPENQCDWDKLVLPPLLSSGALSINLQGVHLFFMKTYYFFPLLFIYYMINWENHSKKHLFYFN